MTKPPLPPSVSGTALAALLALAACGAEAAEQRANVILVLDDATWLEGTARKLRDAGYATAIAGQFAGDPTEVGFDAHCIWHPEHPQRHFGPTVQQDREMATVPDDVSAAALFVDYLAVFGEKADAMPFLACYLPGPTGSSASEAALDQLQATLRARFGDNGSDDTVLLTASHGSNGHSAMTALITWPGPGDDEIIEWRGNPETLRAALLAIANLPHSCVDQVLLGAIRSSAPR